jgi:hypothetical protein
MRDWRFRECGYVSWYVSRVLFWRSWEDDGLTARFATWIRATAKWCMLLELRFKSIPFNETPMREWYLISNR